MEFIGEETIENTLASLSAAEKNVAISFKELGNEQQAFVQFITTENFKILKEKEYDLLVFMLVVIYKSVNSKIDSTIPVPAITADMIESTDEQNWKSYNEEGSQNYTKALDIFFKDYAQEDLLAFVEDTLVDDDDDSISTVGKEILFITAKTLIDCLDQQA